MTRGPATEDLLRPLVPQVLGALARRYGHFDTCEDAVQEALLAAAQQWPRDGRPDDPRAWLITVASRRLTDLLRSDEARRRREDTDLAHSPTAVTPDDGPAGDDSLTLLLLCCHPALSAASQIALTLRGGRRTLHRGDRASAVRAGSDDGAAHQSGQAAHPRRGGDLRAARRRKSGPSGSGSSSRCST